MIVLHIGNTVTWVEGYLDSVVLKALRNNLGYRPEAAEHMKRNLKFHWDGIISTLCKKGRCQCKVKHNEHTHFPSGLLAKAWEIFDQYKIEYSNADDRPLCPTQNLFSFGTDKVLRPYQQDIVDNAIRRGRGIVKLCTGGGKTLVSAAIIVRLGVAPFIFYVPSCDLLEQAHTELSQMILSKDGKPIKIGRVGGGFKEIEDITIMTIQSAIRALAPEKFIVTDKNGRVRRKKVKLFVGDDVTEENGETEEDLGDFREKVKNLIVDSKGMIVDETQHAASETCQTISDWSTSCRYRWGLSATPWRDLNDDILIDACFGKIIADINASYLIDRNFLVEPQLFLVPIKNMRNVKFADYAEAYELGIVRNELRNQHIANMAIKLSGSGRQLLILVKHINHGEILSHMIPGSTFLHGSCTATQRREHLELMRQRKASITIASVIFDEGIDVRPLDGLILAGAGKSMTRALQRVGRVIRPYNCEQYVKKDAIVVDFIDHMKWIKSHSYARRRIYSSEPRFDIKELVLDI